MPRKNRILQLSTILCLFLSIASFLSSSFTAEAHQSDLLCKVQAYQSSPWLTYMGDNQRRSNTTDAYSVANYCSQSPYTLSGNGAIFSQVVVDNQGISYIGDQNGYLHAVDMATRTELWKTFLGTTLDTQCNPQKAGISSTPTIANGIIYVGGGDQYWYAVRQSDGHILWSFTPGSITQPNIVSHTHIPHAMTLTHSIPNNGYYNWASPLIVGSPQEGYFAYIATASFGDCPLVQGKLILLRLSDQKVLSVFNVVPNGQVGGGIWTSPAANVAPVSHPMLCLQGSNSCSCVFCSVQTIYITTGTATLSPAQQPYSESIVALDAQTLTVKSHYRIPFVPGGDFDWGSSPTAFTDKNGNQHVAAINKNGLLYVFNAANVSTPQYTIRVGVGGSAPQSGLAPIAGCTFITPYLYCAGSINVMNGVTYQGNVKEIDPTNGRIIWQTGFNDGYVLGSIISVSTTQREIIVPSGKNVLLLNADTGHIDLRYMGDSTIWSSPSISDGTILVGNLLGEVNILGQLR